jgi:hypothetical protein
MLKDITRPAPVVRCFPLMAQFREILRQLLFDGARMIMEVPANDSGQRPDDPSSKDLTHKPKAVFQWPPDCLWPYTDAPPILSKTKV